jgi:very-short-patch-repair endonuclease
MITGTQLAEVGVSSDWVSNQVVRGLVDRVDNNIYNVHPTGRELTADQRRRAALLHAPDGALVDRHCAAVMHDIWDRAPSGIVHVATPGFTRAMQVAGVSYRRVDRERLDAHRTMINEMPYVDMGMTCLDMGAVATSWQVAKIVERACHWHGLDMSQLKALAHERRTGHGMAASRLAIRLVEAGSRGTQSLSEDIAIDLLVGRLERPLIVCVRGITPLPDYEPDLVDIVTQRIIEIDGGFHREPAQAERDQARDEELLELGWPVLRIQTDDIWRRPAAVQRAMCEFLAAPGEHHAVDIDPVHAAAWQLALRRKDAWLRAGGRASAHPFRARAT